VPAGREFALRALAAAASPVTPQGPEAGAPQCASRGGHRLLPPADDAPGYGGAVAVSL